MQFTKLRNWLYVFSLLYKKILKQSMFDGKFDVKAAQEFEKNV